MSKQKIILRADGSSTIGMGHFVRTLALAEMLKDDFYCIFATRAPSNFQLEELKKVCKEYIDLPEDESHFEAFLDILNGDEIVVLDNYFFETSYQQAIKTKGCRLVCIDDIHDKHYVADIVINHASVSKKGFSINAYTSLLLGFNYALLRPEFLNECRQLKRRESFRHALICFGGADINNVSTQVLDDLSKVSNITHVSIVLGNAFQHYVELEEKVRTVSDTLRVDIHNSINGLELKELMGAVDFGIVPCSTILLESISQQLPVITGYYVDNQVEIATSMTNKYPHVLAIGDLNKEKILGSHIEKLENETKGVPYAPSISEKVCVDIRKAFKDLAKEVDFKIRRVEQRDLDTCFKWVNDPELRQNSISSDFVSLENHTNWFTNKITDANTFFYILERDNTSVGQIRFDLKENYAVINYSLGAEFRGQAIGKYIVKMGIESLCNELDLPLPIDLKALVKDSNKASVKVFERLSFQELDCECVGNEKYRVFLKRFKGRVASRGS